MEVNKMNEEQSFRKWMNHNQEVVNRIKQKEGITPKEFLSEARKVLDITNEELFMRAYW